MRFWPVLLLLAGCLPASYRQARKLEGRYDVPALGAGWVVVAPGGADHAWFNDALGAALYADSNCGPRYRELAIENLSTELFAGLTGVVDRKEERREVGGREGVLRVVYGKLDGIEMNVAALTVNRDACTYDLTYIVPPPNFDAGWPAFERLLDGFSPR